MESKDVKDKVERIKEILPNCTEQEICEALDYCKMDSDDAAERLLSRVETEKNIGAGPMEGKENVGLITTMMPRVDSKLAIQRLHSQGSPLADFSSPQSSAESSVASQLHTVSLDKGKEVVRHTEDDAATTSRSNVRALRVEGPRSSHALQAASDPMALGNNVALGSSEFLEYEQNGPSEATANNSATSHIQPFRDPQDPVLDAPFACSRYGPIQRPARISEEDDPATVEDDPAMQAMIEEIIRSRGTGVFFPRYDVKRNR